MDSGAVSGIALYIDFSAPHGITGSVSDVSINQYFPFIHGIAYGVLGISVYSNMRII